MKLKDIKKLDKKEFVERYPFVQTREWVDGKWEPVFEDNGEPTLEFYINDWFGWTDLLLCWAEKVKPIFDSMPKDVKEKFFVGELKQKYGTVRMYLDGISKEDYRKIYDYTDMLEHLSQYTCFTCGHLTKSSDGKRLFAWKTDSGWISYSCRHCARKRMFESTNWYNKQRYDTKKAIFSKEYSKVQGNWYSSWISCSTGKVTTVDCRELLEGM